MELSRRDLLVGLLGAPLALAACREEISSTLEGEVVGAAHSVGHRLRQARPGRPAEKDFSALDVVVIGAGVAGLSAAWRLKEAGVQRVAVLELESAVGGTSRSGKNEVSAYPWGAHYLPLPGHHNRALVRLLTRMGSIQGTDSEGRFLVDEGHLVREPEERIFQLGRWTPGLFPSLLAHPDDVTQRARFYQKVEHWTRWRDGQGRPAFRLPISMASDDAEVQALDRISFAQWLANEGLTSPVLKWYLEYACRDDYGTTLDTTSAWAGLLYFASRTEHPGEGSSPLLTWPEGNGRLVRFLYEQVASQVATDRLVYAVVPGDDGVEVWAQDVRSERLLGFSAKRVVFASPLFLAPHLIRGMEDATWAKRFEHSPWLVANLTLRDRPYEDGYPRAWDNVLHRSASLGYVDATHQALRDYGPTVWTWYRPFVEPDVKQQREALLSADWSSLAAAVLADLQRPHPALRSLVTRIDFMKWGHAMVRPVPGFCWSPERVAARQPFRGIHFAHTDLSAVALFEEAYDHGIRAAEELLPVLGATQERWR